MKIINNNVEQTVTVHTALYYGICYVNEAIKTARTCLKYTQDFDTYNTVLEQIKKYEQDWEAMRQLYDA